MQPINTKIIVAGTVFLLPEKREEALQAALVMAEATQKESGCIRYEFFTDIANPGRVLIFEEWASESALQNHFQTAHMAVFSQQLPQFIAQPPQIYRYEVAQTEPL